MGGNRAQAYRSVLTLRFLVPVLAVLMGAGIGLFSPQPQAIGVPVPDAEPMKKGRTEPPGVALEARLLVKKDTYVLDLGGKTAEEFRQVLKQVRSISQYPPVPALDLELELRNTSDKEQTI